MLVSGVRSSWDTVATNSPLAWLTSSRRSIASDWRECASACIRAMPRALATPSTTAIWRAVHGRAPVVIFSTSQPTRWLPIHIGVPR